MRHGCCARRCSVFQLVQKTITRRSSKNLLISSQKLLLRRSLCFCDQLTKAFYLQEIPLQYFIPLSVKLKLSTDKKLLSAPIRKHQAACWSSSISLTHRKLSERTHPHPPPKCCLTIMSLMVLHGAVILLPFKCFPDEFYLHVVTSPHSNRPAHV